MPNQKTIVENILDLPDEILLKIASYLQLSDLVRLGCTCKKLNRFCYDETLYRKTNGRVMTLKSRHNLRNEWMNLIGKRRPNELNIVQCNGNLTIPSIFDMFGRIGDQLISLNLSRCTERALFWEALTQCPNITNLNVSFTLFNNKAIKLIAEKLNKIEVINLNGCNDIKDDGFCKLLATNDQSLKSIEIWGLTKLNGKSLLRIGACQNLEKLNINTCHHMTTDSFIEACDNKKWPKLKYIDVGNNDFINDDCIFTLVTNCQDIKSMVISECNSIRIGSINAIRREIPNIKSLDANDTPLIDQSMIFLAQLSQLVYLNIGGTFVTSSGLLVLSRGDCRSNLEEIDLSFLKSFQNPPILIEENDLVTFINSFPKLKRIHLYGHVIGERIRKEFNDKFDLNLLKIFHQDFHQLKS